MLRFFAFSVLLPAAAAYRPSVPIPIGTEFSCSIGCYTNLNNFRSWVMASNTSNNAPVDAHGWPLSDAFTVVFDDRAVPAWDPPLDDPWGWQAPLNGTYYFNLTGKAVVSCGTDPSASATILNTTFDPATWTTSGYIFLDAGAPDLMELNVTSTQLTSSSPMNSGFTNLRVMRPGHQNDGPATMAPELMEMLTGANFHHYRFMGMMGTNNQPGYYGDAGHHALEWADRCYADDALLPNNLRPGCWSGLAWENVVQVAQATGKGLWVNLPVSATVSAPPGQAVNLTTFAGQWATLFKDGNSFTLGMGVPQGTPIYVEHSNEVWNFGFGQYIYNKLAAIDECNVTAHPTAPPCLWSNDGSTDQEKWAQRRHLGKVYEISQTFQAVFGAGSVPSVIRPIYADWPLFPERYNDTLTWANATYGTPSTWLYGMAITGYFGGAAVPNMTLPAIYAEYKNSSDTQFKTRQTFANISAYWGLKLVAYEAGPGWSVGNMDSLGEYILAQRFAAMRDAVNYDVASSWAPAGGNEYNYFSLSGYASRYGMWGATEHFFNLTTPKYCALLDLTGAELPQGCQGW